ncbi:MAG: AraC family transcriptional regulator [Prolixibacteraceae bacterium]|nr:AraC family transcriptional regulator [Prolixibacteraceae bacterium]
MRSNENLPVYSLQAFSAPERRSQQFQLEVFDAHRHFGVKYPHRHDFFEVLFLMKGTGIHVIDGNPYKITPPCIFFMSPGQVHRLELSNDISGFIYIFSPEFYLLNQSNPNRLIEFPFYFTLKQVNPPLVLKTRRDIDFFEFLFNRGVEEASRKEGYPIGVLRSLLDLILTKCADLYPTGSDYVVKGKGHLLVKRFYQLVEEHFRENIPVSHYAQELAVTPNHLTQTIKQLTGKTSTAIIKSKQLIEIKRLLVNTNLAIAEIADRLNFSDQSYFTKFFKHETGMSPLAYRNNRIRKQ